MEEEQINHQTNQSEEENITTNTATTDAGERNASNDDIGSAPTAKRRKITDGESTIDVELYNRTLQELQNAGIIQNFTSTEVKCLLCDTTINMRSAYDLYNWKNHEAFSKHMKQFLVWHHHPEQISRIEVEQINNQSNETTDDINSSNTALSPPQDLMIQPTAGVGVAAAAANTTTSQSLANQLQQPPDGHRTSSSCSVALKDNNNDQNNSSTTGRWTTMEHAAFLRGLAQYGREWKRVAADIPTRTTAQVKSHAQKYFANNAKQETDDHNSSTGSIDNPSSCLNMMPAAAHATVAAPDRKTERKSKVGRPSNVDVELYNNTFQELQKDGIVEKFCSMAVMCSLCNATINMRSPYYLHYWTNHERTVTHQKQLFVRDNNPDTFEQQQKLDNAKKKRTKAMESYIAISTNAEKASVNKSKKTNPCDGLIPYYDNLERDLTLCSLYCLDPEWYRIRDNDRTEKKKQVYATRCPKGIIMYKHMKEQSRCQSCRKIRKNRMKFSRLRQKFKKCGEFFTNINTIIEKQYIIEDDIPIINTFLKNYNNKILTDYGNMRKQQINLLYQHYKSTSSTATIGNNNKKQTEK